MCGMNIRIHEFLVEDIYIVRSTNFMLSINAGEGREKLDPLLLPPLCSIFAGLDSLKFQTQIYREKMIVVACRFKFYLQSLIFFLV